MNLKQLNERANDKHADLMHHTHGCVECRNATTVGTMCQQGQSLAAVSRSATGELDDGFAMHFAMKGGA